MPVRYYKYLIAIIGIVIFLTFNTTDIKDIFSLDYIQKNLYNLNLFYEKYSFLFILIFSFVYIIFTALSIPVATILSLLAGFIFGLSLGTFIVSLSSTIGAMCAFLVSKFMFFNFVQKKYKKQLVTINNQFKKEGKFYIFALRLVPVFPFFIVNVVASILPIRTWTFFWVSALGMLPATIVYVNAGRQLSKINTLNDIISFEILISFSLIGILPLLLKLFLKKLRSVYLNINN